MKCKSFFCTLVVFLNISCFAQKGTVSKMTSAELEKVLAYFENSGNTEQYQAALFLVSNLKNHFSETNKWLDKTGREVPFEAAKYADIEAAAKEFKKLKDSIALALKKIITKDIDVIQAPYLIKNIELAFQAWKQNPWSSSYDFKTFCEYILPYRSLTEPIEDWRSDYQTIYQKSTVDLVDKSDPVELCSKVVANTKHFDFVSNRFDPKSLLGPKELLFWRQGNCPDLANVVLFACRSLGVAVTFDFTPQYAASSNRHFWNSVIDNKGKHIPFNGNQDLPYVLRPKQQKNG